MKTNPHTLLHEPARRHLARLQGDTPGGLARTAPIDLYAAAGARRTQQAHVLRWGFLAAAMIILLSAPPVRAQSHGGGGHGGGHAVGGRGGGWGGGHGGGAGWYGLGLGLGLGWGIANLIEPYPYGYYPYPYGYNLYPAYDYPYPGYVQPYPAAPAVAAPSPAVQQYAPGQGLAPSGTWYYCDSAHGYYPYIRQCAEAWRAVPAVPAGPIR